MWKDWKGPGEKSIEFILIMKNIKVLLKIDLKGLTSDIGEDEREAERNR